LLKPQHDGGVPNLDGGQPHFGRPLSRSRKWHYTNLQIYFCLTWWVVGAIIYFLMSLSHPLKLINVGLRVYSEVIIWTLCFFNEWIGSGPSPM